MLETAMIAAIAISNWDAIPGRATVCAATAAAEVNSTNFDVQRILTESLTVRVRT